ncbi:putative Receptor protein kinase [Melia azedarach]|uniref:Receptor protein kinase n=1 Tax=Melia azedarach TaxID=155640 RepID=A0ACC1Y382_MELAZ|nr:putative Receptor protein kinase [Melia azedarach]
MLWQSFDYPTDTLLPGMKLEINLKTGHKWFLQSWITDASPVQGSFTLGMDPNLMNRLIVWWRGEFYSAWKLLIEGKGLEVMDPSLEESCSANDNEVLRYIHVGLLCVQDQAIDRPTMLDVIFMLKNETMSLPPPRQPAFFINLKANDQQPNLTDKLLEGHLLRDGEVLVSAFGNFRQKWGSAGFSFWELQVGIFQPPNLPGNRYLGIWYNKPADRMGWYYHIRDYHCRTDEPVWIANRNKPILDKSGSLTIDSKPAAWRIWTHTSWISRTINREGTSECTPGSNS